MSNKKDAPLILKKDIQGDNICNLKCAFQYDYAPTLLTIENMGKYLLLKVDEVSVPPVIFNDDFYNIQEVRLYNESIHGFGTEADEKKGDAELVIIHTSRNNTKKLMVCVPIIKSTTTTDDSAMFLDYILAEVKRTAPAKGQETIYKNTTFTLNKFIPSKPFYSYNGSLPWNESSAIGDEKYNYVVFDRKDSITMSLNSYNAMKKIITDEHKIKAVPMTNNEGGVFYNPDGPKPPNTGEIYIDCQPTGDDGEILVPAKLSSGGVLDNELLKRMWNFTMLKIFIGGLVMVLLWHLATKILKGIASKTKNM
jgi:carbonic anhydrase